MLKLTDHFHPAVMIICWCLLVLVSQFLSSLPLLLLSLLILTLALCLAHARFLQLIRRTRWILISMMVIYLFTTPGELIMPSMGMFSPVYEGVQLGVQQLLRLVLALAGLAILLKVLHRSLLIAGLWTLFWPLRLVGVSRERIAVRLALTLQYAEAAIATTGRKQALQSLIRLFEPPEIKQHEITIPDHRISWKDLFLLTAVLSLFSWIYLGKPL